MKKSLKIFLVLTFAFNIANLNAQISNLSDLSGTVLKQQAYFEVNGSPYFYPSWVKGDVIFKNGKMLKDIALKYDLVKDELLFAGKNNEECYFNDPVHEFKLSNSVFRSGFAVLKKLNENSFYEVLVDGDTKLLKKNSKSISETKEFNSATTSKNINENINYYIAKSNSIVQLKKDDIKALANAIDVEKSSLILEFSQKNKFSPKKEEDLKAIVNFYNTL